MPRLTLATKDVCDIYHSWATFSMAGWVVRYSRHWQDAAIIYAHSVSLKYTSVSGK
jgi:hypothetical protein